MSSCIRLYAGFYCDAKFLYAQTMRRSCKHLVDHDAKFCSECGKPRLLGANEPIESYTPGDKCEEAGVYNGFSVYEVAYSYHLNQPEAFVIGKRLGALMSGDSIAPVEPNIVGGLPKLFAQLRGDPRIAQAMLLSTSCYTAPSIGLYMFQSE